MVNVGKYNMTMDAMGYITLLERFLFSHHLTPDMNVSSLFFAALLVQKQSNRKSLPIGIHV